MRGLTLLQPGLNVTRSLRYDSDLRLPDGDLAQYLHLPKPFLQCPIQASDKNSLNELMNRYAILNYWSYLREPIELNVLRGELSRI